MGACKRESIAVASRLRWRSPMTRFGYHVSHEQHPPSALLRYVCAAEAAGFSGAMSADHFHPWLEENGQSGFAWSWLGAALHATSCSIGVVTAPGDRYHPAIIAQAAATLAEMFPGRFWIALGSGEALNEHVTGNHWPSKDVRNERLRECADVMRPLWRGETVTHRGHVVVEDAKLYSRPEQPPRLLGAAVSEETAEWVASWADGLITTGRRRDEMRSMIEAFHRAGGTGKPIVVQHVLSWAPKLDDARRAAYEQWRFATLPGDRLWDLRMPRDFATATRDVSIDVVTAKIPTSSSLAEHAEQLRVYTELGVDEVYIHNVGLNQLESIEAFGREVLPVLSS
jgi:coenzyme F420-dependent glucose-6-phosphate dehydrogenase